MIQPIMRTPSYVLLRGFFDDGRLGECIAKAWARIPAGARRATAKHWTKPEEERSGSKVCRAD